MQIVEIALDTIDSTSEYAKRNYPSFDASKITCITAEEQTQGKGTRQRPWISPRGVNIYATFYFRLKPETADLTTLAQVAALGLASILSQEGLYPKIKWPNDLLLNGKKISGVLCETLFEKESIAIFLGIGINVNMEKEDLAKIDQPATSLKIETGKSWDRKKLLHSLQLQLNQDLALFQAQGFAPFRKQLAKFLDDIAPQI
jgi:BirA family biotin operon repressor/biotin-[acetyl-CoA-carboxylase] ligase